MNRDQASAGAAKKLPDLQLITFFEQQIIPAMAKLRPRLKQLERKLRASGVRHHTWEDLEQDTCARIWQTLQSEPVKVEGIHGAEAYVWTVARQRAIELRRGRGIQTVRNRVETVFRCRQDRLARWRSEGAIVGGFLQWMDQAAVSIFEFWKPILDKFNRLKFWNGNKLQGTAIDTAVFDVFACTGSPVKLAHIALILASHLEALDPVWVAAAEAPDTEAGVIQFPPRPLKGEDDVASTREEIRSTLDQLRDEPIKKRHAFLKELDFLELLGRGFVNEDVLASLIGINREALAPWLYKWVRATSSEREKLFDVGKHPEKITWKLRRKVKKILGRLGPLGIIACICHLTRM